MRFEQRKIERGSARARRWGCAAAALAGVTLAGPSRAGAIETPALLDSLQHTAFLYFWNEANPANGLVKDRSTAGSPCSIASLGFGLSAICIGIDHGWVSRATGRGRVLTALETLWNGPQGSASSGTIGYQGFFYHFLDMNTARRTWSSELSSIDTALLLAGVIDTRQYFTGADSLDTRVRALADSLYRRVDWDWMRASGVGLRMGWKPEGGFSGFGTWVGYNEAMIMYLLALGSPTHPVPASSWNTWTSGYDLGTFYGYTYIYFPPLFGHQYSHCWVDFRSTQDAVMRSLGWTYFENSRRATLAAREYCIDNPGGFVGYGPEVWGLTACDDPFVGYLAHGAPPAQDDNGTIAPTAAASSIAFAPEVVIPTLHHWYDTYHAQLWSPYGFKDAFNLGLWWWDTDVLGIDQGPIIIMIENHLSQGIWRRFMQNADVLSGLQRAGFTWMTTVEAPIPAADAATSLEIAPNPFRGATTITYRLAAEAAVRLEIYDVQGRRVRAIDQGTQAPGAHAAVLDGGGLAPGVYVCRLVRNGRLEAGESRLVRVR